LDKYVLNVDSSTNVITGETVIQKYSDEWVDGIYYGKNGVYDSRKGKYSWLKAEDIYFEEPSGWLYGRVDLTSKKDYPEYELIKSKWAKIDGKWYCFDGSGYMLVNEWYDGYWFNRDGSWDSAYCLRWRSNATGWWGEDVSGWWPASQWLKIDGYWYYFNASGYMVTNQYVDGYWIGADGICR
jgi:hypothetical protein